MRSRFRAGHPASADSIFGAMGKSGEAPGPWRRARWLLWGVAMWGFLIYPIAELGRLGLPSAATAAVVAGLAAFAGCWLRTIWLALATTAPFRAVAPTLASCIVVGTVLAFAGGTPAFLGLFIYLSIAAAVALPLRFTLPAVAAATGAAALLLWRAPQPVTGDTVFAQLSLVFWLGIMMWSYRRIMLQARELRHARDELARLAVTEERLRFARDLHDLLGHSLSVISLKAQLARRLTGDPAVAAEIADIEAVTGHALVEVREAVTGYRATSLLDELDTARAALGAAGITMTTDLTGIPLDPRADALFSWVVREAVTNTVRHSKAAACRVALSATRETAVLVISDDGVGASASVPTGNGLTGLEERVGAAGGRLHAGPDGGPGFRLTASLPLGGAGR